MLAQEASAAAADHAGVVVRELTSVEDAAAATRLLRAIWSGQPDGAIPPELIRALHHSGNCALGAFESDTLLGSAIGFFGRHGGDLYLHSHILGVHRTRRHRSIGYALKLEQRAWALAGGVETVRWTTDPLVRRNGYFNLMKLGAAISAYDENFYGPIPDTINSGDDTDRVLISWELSTPETERACAHPSPPPLDAAALRAAGATVALDQDAGGDPRVGEDVEGPVLLVFVPEDVVAIRRTDPPRARRWRLALRGVLTRELRAGHRVTAITHDGYYVVERS